MNMRQPEKAARAVTLIELLVTIAVMMVVGGLALGIMTESERATHRITSYQSALQYCQQALTQTSDNLRAAVAPSNVTHVKPKHPTPRFEKDKVSFFAFTSNLPGLSRVTIGAVHPKNRQPLIQRMVGPVTEADPGQPKIKKPRNQDLGGVSADGFTPSIQFAFAPAPMPGKKPDYQDSWTSSTWPALIQITVQAVPDQDPKHPIKLQTAVIPGLLVTEERSASPAEAPQPSASPTDAPTPPAAQPLAQPATEQNVLNIQPSSVIKEVKK